MSKKIRIIIEIIIIVLVISASGYYFYLQYQKSRPLVDEKAKIVEQIATLTFIKEDLEEKTKQTYKESFEIQAKKFLDNPQGPESFWPLIKIEQIKQLVGDYDGAKQALIWTVELQPKSFLAQGNLANLYFRHFQNFAKAEEHFLKAIESDSPATITYYFELHEIYRYFYKQDTDLAEDILKQGIERYAQESQVTDLMAVLAHYYRDLGRKEEAREYYLKILEINPDSQVAKQGLED